MSDDRLLLEHDLHFATPTTTPIGAASTLHIRAAPTLLCCKVLARFSLGTLLNVLLQARVIAARPRHVGHRAARRRRRCIRRSARQKYWAVISGHLPTPIGAAISSVSGASTSSVPPHHLLHHQRSAAVFVERSAGNQTSANTSDPGRGKPFSAPAMLTSLDRVFDCLVAQRLLARPRIGFR
mmetsp:Transcript_42664/g.118084  ORF Transcript_42664/g.118084 Transcript_42664/m.118084 type:complete len:182 (-) Transcript_42664:169-714(-)